MLRGGDAQELPHRRGVGRGAVARFAFQAVALDQAVEVVAALAGIEPARKPHGAKRPRQVLEARAVELAPQESVVEARVVGDEHAAGEALVQLGGDARAKRGARSTISCVMPVSAWIGAGITPPGIDQRGPLRGERKPLDLKHARSR